MWVSDGSSLVEGIYCNVIMWSFLRLLKLHKLEVGKLDPSRWGLTRCHGVLDHGFNLRRNIPLTANFQHIPPLYSHILPAHSFYTDVDLAPLLPPLPAQSRNNNRPRSIFCTIYTECRGGILNVTDGGETEAK